MEIKQIYIDYIENVIYDEDIRQDLYVKLLEYDGPEIIHWRTWIVQTANNIRMNAGTKDQRRRELEAEAVETLEGLVGIDDNRDPFEYVEVEEMVKSRFQELSPLLHDTLQGILDGKSPQQIADEAGVDANTIYQRTHQIKKQLENT